MISSQWWCPPHHVSTAYMCYRVFVAVFFVIFIICHMEQYPEGIKWLIFMTNQGILFLTIHFCLEAVLVVTRWVKERYMRYLDI